WQCVSIDSINVPRCGERWGRPQWFAEQLEKHGLMLVWSRLSERFGIVRRRNPNLYTWLRTMERGGMGSEPIPLVWQSLQVILDMWKRFRRINPGDIRRELERVQRDEARRKYEETGRQLDEDREDVMDYVDLTNKHRTKVIMPLPKKIDIRPLSKRQKKSKDNREQLRRRHRIHVPVGRN
ncbi:MAG: hypothetical protein ACYTF6_13525, partial [Planctomycetota bacterium]